MGLCECGCNADAKGADFVPGHDQRLRTQLEKRAGGILALRSLVVAAETYVVGESTEQDLLLAVRKAFARTAAGAG